MLSPQRHWLKRFEVGIFLGLIVSGATLFCTPAAGPALALTTEEIAAQVERLQQSEERWLQIDLSSQRLFAWAGGTPVYAVIVSTGKPSTPTVTGVFAIQSMHRLARMRGADYDVPNVPWTMYFYRGYAIHGTYWHHNFGTPVSHGCVNVAVDHAQWLFNWADVGTPVVVQP
ncbi:L,D-transpeptidase [Leptolyngbya sp. KIOST-1]|uniref:L,D-transpeptidase n=1 Tax=Leptolyngbya sp. KIOST-1 TaxID=1229172 RepID=UPI00090774A5|nr:L,D-transpeptidase [Leptolyngbya sp. KIOST-1]